MAKLMAGIAALAMLAGAAAADPGGKGGGGGGGHGPAGADGRGGAAGGHGGKAHGGEHGGGKVHAEGKRGDRGPGAVNQRGGGEVARGAAAQGDKRGRGGDRANDRGAERPAHARSDKGAPKGLAGQDRGRVREVSMSDEPGPRRAGARGRPGWDEGRVRGLIGGCPPGLAMKDNGCMPPGQLRQRRPWQAALASPAWWGLAGLPGGEFAYVDGYLVRLADDRVDGWLPLLGGALAPGNPWPSAYPAVELPQYYQDYYGLGPSYRYYDDVLYRLDPQTSAISSIAALLTGDQFAVGQPMPLGYDVYNVPYGYRDRYSDGPDALYRYNDGYIYQVDPETRLVAAAIELLT